MKTFIACFALFAALIWYIGTHGGHAQSQPLTNAQASSQAVALARVAAGMNGNTAIYTPLLYAAAANLAASNASTNSAN